MSTNGAAAQREADATLNIDRATRRQIPRAAYVLFAVAVRLPKVSVICRS